MFGAFGVWSNTTFGTSYGALLEKKKNHRLCLQILGFFFLYAAVLFQ
jgi:hypothetical protein